MTILTETQDAYGHAMLDYLEGYDPVVVIERDDGLVCTDVPVEEYFAEFEDWPLSQRTGMSFVRRRVLDVGCGAGRVPLYLQGCGLDVVGIDNSPAAIVACERRDVQDARLMSVTQVSRTRLGEFDTVVMYGNNFGLVGNASRARWLLRRFGAMLPSDGLIVAESRDPYATEQPYHLAYHKRNKARGRMAGQLRIRVRYLTWATPWFDYLLASPSEMQSILRDTGWQLAHVVPGDDGQYTAIISRSRR